MNIKIKTFLSLVKSSYSDFINNKKAYTWWHYIGAAILILVTLVVAIFITRKLTGRSFAMIDKIFGFF